MRSLCWIAVVVLAAAGLGAQTTVALVPDRDNSIFADSASLSNGAGPVVVAGRTNHQGLRRALVRFDVAGSLPPGSRVLQARLEARVNATRGVGRPATLHRVLASWGEGTSSTGVGAGAAATTGDATWVHRHFSTTTWQQPGGDFVAAVSASAPVASVLGSTVWTSPGLAADVQSWADAPSANHGWLIRVDETLRSATLFASRESATPPRLVITFGPAATSTSYGTGCGTPPMTLAPTAVPRLGDAGFGFAIIDGPANGVAAIYLARRLAASPIDLGGGCTLLLDPPALFAMIAARLSPLAPIGLDPGGAGTIPVPLPSAGSLAGVRIHAQATVTDPASSVGFRTSNAVSLVLGF